MPSVLTLGKPDGEAVMEGPMLFADPVAVGLLPGDDSVPAQFIQFISQDAFQKHIYVTNIPSSK